jgi:hypothetical protein
VCVNCEPLASEDAIRGIPGATSRQCIKLAETQGHTQQPGFLNRELEIRHDPREVKFLMVRPICMGN